MQQYVERVRTSVGSGFCVCDAYSARGCWEHSDRDARVVMTWRLGVDDGRQGHSAGRPGFYLRPFTTWASDEQDYYLAGWAWSTGRAARIAR